MALQSAEMSPNKMASESPPDPTIDGNSIDASSNPTADDYWMMVARDAYIEAESYFDANIRADLERNLSHFANRHAPGSKYYSEQYKFRHKGFRPKTRSMVRRNEASAAVAMFSTADVVSVKAARSKHPSHRVSADINQKLLQYRLENTIPWYLTVIGAYQETLNSGICISHQCWDYEELPEFDPTEKKMEIGPDNIPPKDEMEVEIPDELSTAENNMPQTGDYGPSEPVSDASEPVSDATNEYEDMLSNVVELKPKKLPTILKDTPAVELRPVENVFFSVGSDWRDPAGTSPFIIDKIPMYIDEIKAMAEPSTGTKIPWFKLTEAQLLTGVTTDYDAIRRQREDNREDSKDQRHLHRGFDIAWVHRNIIRKDGRDWIYYTLGIHYRLSDPIPLQDEYPWLKPGERPYVIGISNIEAHKNYPDSIVGLGAKTQQEANEINNQRRDNVMLCLNRRYIVKRAAMIDYSGLQRNVPGGVTETDDPNQDIRIEAPPDVTASSYQEQDRVNLDFDELTGMFSGSSVGSNKNMNETVGGLELLSGDADNLTEYPLRTFVITWVVPVLKQLIKLEQHHESDGALLNLIGEDLKLWQKHSIDRVTDEWIQGSMNIQVNVGFGSTNPQQRVNRLATGLQTILSFAPQMAEKLDGGEVAKEVLGALGFQGSDRFFPEKLESPPMKGPKEGDVTEQDQAKLDQDYRMHQEDMEDKQMQRQWEIEKYYEDQEQKLQERVLKKELSDKQFDEKMQRLRVDRQNKVDEMKVRLKTGQGI